MILLNLLFVILDLLNHGVTGVHAVLVSVSVTEGDSVTLHTGVIKQQHEDIEWYFNNTKLDADVSDMCTDVQCNEGTERFRDRLKLDRETGALTIMDIRNTHSGVYQPVNGDKEKTFIVTVHVDPDAHRNQANKTQGESVSFNPGIRRDLIDVMKCFFNDILITEITRVQSQSCADVQCKERFTDRLKLDNQSASLSIMNIKSTDSGDYTSEIVISSDRRFSITREKTFSLTVVSPPPSHLSGGAIAGIVVLVVVIIAAVVAGVIYYRQQEISSSSTGCKYYTQLN
ncbi:uncharacterized protein LOC130216147 [Danio aesculapii]|uniref:uncharacterized protein LOC130216147 n=1 Tax=Danio aesculapii TaxID=1142201 RepID=UPI0024C024F2|nr:uncharacterized protein LOC130216147 [Danio aesculapii]